MVARACSDKLLSLTLFKRDDHKSLRKFSAKVRGVITTLKYEGYPSQLECYSVIQQISSKLPLTLWKSRGKKVRVFNQSYQPSSTSTTDTMKRTWWTQECKLKVTMKPIEMLLWPPKRDHRSPLKGNHEMLLCPPKEDHGRPLKGTIEALTSNQIRPARRNAANTDNTSCYMEFSIL